MAHLQPERREAAEWDANSVDFFHQIPGWSANEIKTTSSSRGRFLKNRQISTEHNGKREGRSGGSNPQHAGAQTSSQKTSFSINTAASLPGFPRRENVTALTSDMIRTTVYLPAYPE